MYLLYAGTMSININKNLTVDIYILHTLPTADNSKIFLLNYH